MKIFNTPAVPESEDCLYLNVYAPAAPGSNRAVMFWLYGGFLQFGAASTPEYDGTSFAANQDVVIVTVNYRTNVFGFPMSPELPLAERNLGFLDQRLALDWVQRNVRAFGGDPGKVTIFGQSAGGGSVEELITTFPENPPFRAAIMESEVIDTWINHNNSNVPAWDALVAALNCSTGTSALACVRAANASVIQNIEDVKALSFLPVSDNVTQLEYALEAYATGSVAKVPVLIGTTAQEGRIFAYGQNDTATFLNATFPGQTALQNAILAAYPASEYPAVAPGFNSAYDIIAAIITDFEFQCPCGRLANLSTKAGIPTWRYYFNATFPNTQLFPGFGVYHSSEIPEVFGTYPTANATASEAQLSVYMQKVWADFAKNPSAGPGWAAIPKVNVLATPTVDLVQDGSLDKICALYDQVYTELGYL